MILPTFTKLGLQGSIQPEDELPPPSRAMQRAIDYASRREFRARLRAASYSRDAMAEVMVETLRALGYDLGAWTLAQWTVTDHNSLDYDDGYNAGYRAGVNDD